MPENTPPPETLEQERLRLLFQQAHSASIIASLGALTCLAVMLNAKFSIGAVAWFTAVLGATVLRFALYRRFFATDSDRHPGRYWLRHHLWTGALVGLTWGGLPLVPMLDAPAYVQNIQTLVPGFLLMAAITSYGVYLSQYTTLLLTTGLAAMASLLLSRGQAGVPEVLLYVVFAPVLMLTARRYRDSLLASMRAQRRAEQLVERLTEANSELKDHNEIMVRQRAIIEQEEALAKHVFRQLTLGGDRPLSGVQTWNQSMGSLSGDLIQSTHGPDGQAYIFLGDFTGHGLPAALGALPASSVFLAMAGKGLPLDAIASELNRKLYELLPTGYFCCAALLELDAAHRHLKVWNGGLPPVLLRRAGSSGYERIVSHSLPLGIVDDSDFDANTRALALRAGDLVYAYSDGLTEAVNAHGEMWGNERLEHFLERPDLPTPRLPALIEAVLEFVDRAPASDDISIVEIMATPTADVAADAA